jgi:pimeloyl-ACP methyl ester carboxylesterase
MIGSSQHVDLNGRKVRVVSDGSGAPAVFLESGLGGPAEEWALVTPPLARFATVIAWDRPGIGGSPGPALESDEYVDIAARLIEGLAGGPVVAVGHSLGGLHVFGLALARPDLVAGLVLVDSSHPDQDQRLPMDEGWLLKLSRQFARTPAPLRSAVGAGARMMVRGLAPLVARTPGNRRHDGNLPAGEEAIRLLGDIAPIVAARPDGFANEWDTLPDLFAWSRRMRAGREIGDLPVVVLTATEGWKNQDHQAVWLALQHDYATLTTGARQVTLDCGHMIPFIRPAEVVRAVADVWQEATRRS